MTICDGGFDPTSPTTSTLEEHLSYKSYKATVERRRAALQAKLFQANDLRRTFHLPLWDIEAEIAHQCPLLPEEAWTAQQQDWKAFARFKRGQLVGKVMPSSPHRADWQAQRALVLRRAFLEHQTRQAWLNRPHAGLPQASPHQP